MTPLNSPSSAPAAGEAIAYTRPRIILHWLSAVVILWATFSGFGVALLDSTHPLRQWVEAFNPQLTSLFIPFFTWRLWLTIKSSVQQSPSTPQNRLANAVHMTIYAVVFGVLITGVLMMRHPVTLLEVFPLPQLVHSENALTELHQVHHVLCAALAGLVALHVLAVVAHQVRGAPVLGRMISR